jgi:hypothetical protein
MTRDEFFAQSDVTINIQILTNDEEVSNTMITGTGDDIEAAVNGAIASLGRAQRHWIIRSLETQFNDQEEGEESDD